MTFRSCGNNMLTRLASLIIAFAVPFLLLVLGARLLMLPWFMQLEYNRPGFPADPYGFTTEQRLAYGPLGIEYLLTPRDISFLAGQTLPGDQCYPPGRNRCPMFNPRELQHMLDVKSVTHTVFHTAALWAALAGLAAGWLLHMRHAAALRYAVLQGSMLTLALIAALSLAVLLAWNTFFDSFHNLFFAPGTWVFYYSDTLIRLYPEQFWVDAAICTGIFCAAGALVLLSAARCLPQRSAMEAIP
jgi:integral membrane protein (TIGR01906 family)